MTNEEKKAARKRKMKRMAITAVVAALLALGCKALPDAYRGPCETVLHICTGGL